MFTEEALSSHVQCSLPFSAPPELQMMVEHHLGQQQQGEEPEGAAESTGTQETCPPETTDTQAESRLGASGTAQSTFQPRRRQAYCGEESSSSQNHLQNMDISAHIACICISSPFLTK